MRSAFSSHLLPDIPRHLSQSLGEATVSGGVKFSGDSSKVRNSIQRIMSCQGDEMNMDLINWNWLSWEHGIEISRWRDEEAIWDFHLGKFQAKGKDHKGTLSKWSSSVTSSPNTWSSWKWRFLHLLNLSRSRARNLHATQIITHILKFKKYCREVMW